MAQQAILESEHPAAEIAARPELAAHLKECPKCADLVAKLEKLAAATQSLPTPAGNNQAPAAFLEQVRQYQPPAARRAAVPRLLWMRRLAAAAIVVVSALIALQLCLHTPAARAEGLLRDLVSWNLQLTESHDPAERAKIYHQHADEMKRRVAGVTLSTAEQKIADALLQNADSLAAEIDPLADAAHFAALSATIKAQEAAVTDAAQRGQLEALRGHLVSEGIEKNLRSVDPAKLAPAEKEQWNQLERQVPAPTTTHDAAGSTGATRGAGSNAPTVEPTERQSAKSMVVSPPLPTGFRAGGISVTPPGANGSGWTWPLEGAGGPGAPGGAAGLHGPLGAGPPPPVGTPNGTKTGHDPIINRPPVVEDGGAPRMTGGHGPAPAIPAPEEPNWMGLQDSGHPPLPLTNNPITPPTATSDRSSVAERATSLAIAAAKNDVLTHAPTSGILNKTDALYAAGIPTTLLMPAITQQLQKNPNDYLQSVDADVGPPVLRQILPTCNWNPQQGYAHLAPEAGYHDSNAALENGPDQLVETHATPEPGTAIWCVFGILATLCSRRRSPHS